VEVTGRRRDGQIELEVTDTGRGLSDADLQRSLNVSTGPNPRFPEEAESGSPSLVGSPGPMEVTSSLIQMALALVPLSAWSSLPTKSPSRPVDGKQSKYPDRFRSVFSSPSPENPTIEVLVRAALSVYVRIAE
jgi:hypothetical protein